MLGPRTIKFSRRNSAFGIQSHINRVFTTFSDKLPITTELLDQLTCVGPSCHLLRGAPCGDPIVIGPKHRTTTREVHLLHKPCCKVFGFAGLQRGSRQGELAHEDAVAA